MSQGNELHHHRDWIGLLRPVGLVVSPPALLDAAVSKHPEHVYGEKLRIDAGRFPDTMDQRYGAWSRLLVLFRMIHDGAKRGDLCLPPRYGHLFDPDREGWAFLEGRSFIDAESRLTP